MRTDFGGSGDSWTPSANNVKAPPAPAQVISAAMLLLLAGCASGSGGGAAPDELLTWPPGEYSLEGHIEYQQDTERNARTVRADYQADLTIGDDSFIHIENPSGVCRARLPREILQDEAQRRRTVPCGDVSYVLKPRGKTIIAEIRVTVLESIRRRGQCVRWSTQGGQRVCVAYEYTTVTRRATKTGPLRVVRKGEF